jgi:hypothetical protein
LRNLAGRYDASVRPGARLDGISAGDRRTTRFDVFGYPAAWPAGPWIVPLFWLSVLLGTWLLRWLT